MGRREIILAILILLFFSVGAVIDYWQASMEHLRLAPQFLKDYFLVFWLIIYTGILPFLMVFTASNLDKKTALLYLAFLLIGASLWDVIFSYFWAGVPVSPQPSYFSLGGANYGLTTGRIYIWHFLRIAGAGLILCLLRKKTNL